MTELRELIDAELDIVGGGAKPPPMMNQGGGELKLVEEIIVDILKLFEPQQKRKSGWRSDSKTVGFLVRRGPTIFHLAVLVGAISFDSPS